MTANRLFGTVLATLGAFAAADIALAQSTTSPAATTEVAARPDRRGGGMENVLGSLNLTDAQRSQIAAIMEKHRAAIQPLRDQMRPAEGREGMSSVREQMRAAQQKLAEDVGAVLTPEQRQQFESMQAQRREQMRNRGDREGRGKGMHREGR